MGAGVIPLAVHNEEVWFLFQKTFSGRKVGTLIDFGGGLGHAEGYRDTAIREFVEETETMYFEDNLQHAYRSPDRIQQQIELVNGLFEQTLGQFPHWWRPRMSLNPAKPKDWRTYFIQFPYRDVSALNREWATDSTGRFKKRRELVWVTAEQLLEMYTHRPEALWKRVRQLENAGNLVHEIDAVLGSN